MIDRGIILGRCELPELFFSIINCEMIQDYEILQDVTGYHHKDYFFEFGSTKYAVMYSSTISKHNACQTWLRR